MILISVALLINTSCAKEEKITFDYDDQINVLHQLANKDSNNKFIRPDEGYYVFCSDNEYKTFAKKYFTGEYESRNVDFKKSDLLVINFNWGDKAEGTLYNVESIFKDYDKVEVILKRSGEGSVDSKDNIEIEEFGYIEIPKGTILPTDVVLINKE